MSLSDESLKKLNAKTIVLASASPRRREIMESLGLRFEVVKTLEPDTNDPTKYETRADYVLDTAAMKAKEVFARCKDDPALPKADIVIGADTVVVWNDQVLEKPSDEAEARKMLKQLSGSKHAAMTGVYIIGVGTDHPIEIGVVETTHVQFVELDDQTIDEYVATGEPFDKAGAYGIQGKASAFATVTEGDFWTVVGLPKDRLCLELQKLL